MISSKLLSRTVAINCSRPNLVSYSKNYLQLSASRNFAKTSETDIPSDYSSPSSLASEKSINQVTLLGRVGSQPLKRGSSEHPVVTFSLATNSNYTYENGDVRQKTEWHRICVFKPYLRDVASNYVDKGQRVLIQGRIIYGETKDNDGITRHTSSVVADELICFKNNA